jgi:uncharacterized protein DUF2784
MLAMMNIYSHLADVVLVVHVLFVAFVGLGFVVIWIGYFAGWQFASDIRFRFAHLLAMAFVLAEAVFGVTCPLTTWESDLRSRTGEGGYDGSFIQHWVGRLLFYECSERTFTVLYAAFFALILLTFWIVPPRWSRRAKS